jgi:predicted nucleic acid-binding protein
LITAVDTNVLVDVLYPDPTFGPASAAALRECLEAGALVACEVVWAETAAGFPNAGTASDALETLRIDFSALDDAASLHAAERWRAYRQAGGARQRVVGDFLVGAHASVNADRLLTRDRGFYRSYFNDLAILDPTATA